MPPYYFPPGVNRLMQFKDDFKETCHICTWEEISVLNCHVFWHVFHVNEVCPTDSLLEKVHKCLE